MGENYYKIAIIGAGKIGRKRAIALESFPNCTLDFVVDIDETRAKELASSYACQWSINAADALSCNAVDIVIVSTVNAALHSIVTEALKKKKHVLCEKPLGCNTAQAKEMVDTSEANGCVLKIGFNHRHHPAIKQAKEMADHGVIGRLHFMRAVYGHGGRDGYEKEWRCRKELSGGGELLDQGVHILDLFRWFAGDFKEVFAQTATSYWDIEVEDNAFAILNNEQGVRASMHTSWTQWKNKFLFEVFGEKGYLIVDGLGGSYGTETLKVGLRQKGLHEPQEKLYTFAEEDVSWVQEWRSFCDDIVCNANRCASGRDGYEVNRLVEALYLSAHQGTVVSL